MAQWTKITDSRYPVGTQVQLRLSDPDGGGSSSSTMIIQQVWLDPRGQVTIEVRQHLNSSGFFMARPSEIK